MSRRHDVGELLVVPAMRANGYADGRFGLTRKFVDGMAAYAAHWPGRVTTLLHRSDEPDSNLDHVAVSRGDLPFAVEWVPKDWAAKASRMSRAGIMLATLDGPQIPWLAMSGQTGVPLIWVTEYSVNTRGQIIDAEVPGFLRRQKRKFDTALLEHRFRDAICRAKGMQCNGTPTYEAYRHLNPRGMLFFDSRVDAGMTASDDDIARRSQTLVGGAPLRLAFSGRLLAMKGVDHLPLVAAELRRLRVPFSLDIYGGGDREDALHTAIRRHELEGQVLIRGVQDFQSELVPAMKHSVDLFVCCHPQGDPSCTYLETMACGTPIAGYGNEAWQGLATHAKAGWVTPMGRPLELARQIASLHHERQALVTAAKAVRDFARKHAFDITMRNRVEHLLARTHLGEHA